MAGRSRSTQTIETEDILNLVIAIAAGIFTVRVMVDLLLPNVTAIAKQVTVKIDGANTGSGVIIQRRADRYLVLSNWHVLDAPGRFTLTTFDGRRQAILPQSIRRIPQVDLAVVEFHSRDRYHVAKMGKSDRAIEGSTIYISGWADPSPVLPGRTYQFLVGKISGRIEPPRDGYGLVYTANALPGMSGGPIFNSQGHLIGINGRALTDIRTGMVNSVLGIEIERFNEVRSQKSEVRSLLSHIYSQYIRPATHPPATCVASSESHLLDDW
jgi:S1-C subfamily serine protease